MPEQAKEATVAKKKGKLPVIVMMLVLLGGGGYFGMKMKGGAPQKLVIKAAPETVPFDKEFLVNLYGPNNTYLRVEISLELREDFKKETLDPSMPKIKNKVIQIFRSKGLQDVSAEKTDDLQQQIAKSINEILICNMTGEEKKAQIEYEKAAADAARAQSANVASKANGASPDSDQPETWACPAGPVLNVYFTSFTTQ